MRVGVRLWGVGVRLWGVGVRLWGVGVRLLGLGFRLGGLALCFAVSDARFRYYLDHLKLVCAVFTT